MDMTNIKKAINEAFGAPLLDEAPKVKAPEWIWVEGYKGTDKDMKCRDYQYELGKQFDMPEDAEIDLCSSGFHFCTKLNDVFKYYDVKDGNRFFKVTALVRKDVPETDYNRLMFFNWNSDTKETSKSIVFTRELTTDEIIEAHPEVQNNLTEEEKVLVREVGFAEIDNIRDIADLEKVGYVHEVADIIVRRYGCKAYDLAMALSKQTDISMDARIIAIFSSTNERKLKIDEFALKHVNIPSFGNYGTLGVDLSKITAADGSSKN